MKGKILLFILGLSVFLQAVSGQEKLNFDDVYIDETETLLSPLPEIREWIDHRHYLEVREDKILGRNTEYRAFWLKYLLGKELSE